MPSHSPSLQSRVRPGISRRDEFPLEPSKAALLIVDVQRYLTTPPAVLEEAHNQYFWKEAVPRMIRNLQRLVQAFRGGRDGGEDDSSTVGTSSAGCEVIFTYLQARSKDGRGVSLDYKLSGPLLAGIPRVGETNLFLDSLQPDLESGKGDILLPKTSCSVFQSTNLEYLLRNLGVEQVVVTGQLTDQCVESAVRDAADLGFFVTVCDDACAASSSGEHMKGLQSMKGFSRIASTTQLIDEIARGTALQQREKAASILNGPKETAIVSEDQVLDFLRTRGLEDTASSLAKAFCEQKESK